MKHHRALLLRRHTQGARQHARAARVTADWPRTFAGISRTSLTSSESSSCSSSDMAATPASPRRALARNVRRGRRSVRVETQCIATDKVMVGRVPASPCIGAATCGPIRSSQPPPATCTLGHVHARPWATASHLQPPLFIFSPQSKLFLRILVVKATRAAVAQSSLLFEFWPCGGCLKDDFTGQVGQRMAGMRHGLHTCARASAVAKTSPPVHALRDPRARWARLT